MKAIIKPPRAQRLQNVTSIDSPLWAQVDTLIGPPEPEVKGFTYAEFRERYKIGERLARKRINAYVKEGKFIVGYRFLPAGGKVKVFRPA